jgi:hypothetical protein
MADHRRKIADWIELEGISSRGPSLRPWKRVGSAVTLAIVLLAPGISYGITHHAASPPLRRQMGSSASPKGIPSPSTVPLTSKAAPTTTTVAAVVLVANGSGHGGAAGRTTGIVSALGVATAPPANATNLVAQTTIYYLPGFATQASALSAGLAGRLGMTPPVASMPASPPVTSLAGAQILVLLGSDEKL